MMAHCTVYKNSTLGAFKLVFSSPPLDLISTTSAATSSIFPAHNGATTGTFKVPPSGRRKRITEKHLKLPSFLFFAHEPLDKAKYPAKVRNPFGGPLYPVTKKPGDTDAEESEDFDIDLVNMEGNFDDKTVIMSFTQQNAASTEQVIASEQQMAVSTQQKPASASIQVRPGGRAATSRKISAELDEDDMILVQMKEQRRTDKEIAEHLTKLGRTNYNYKTIGSRWKRLRVALAAAKDKELDLNISAWSALDDKALLRAFTLADKAVIRLRREADEQRWKIVAQKLKDLKPETYYSTKACRERYEALQTGIAICPPELDENLEQRKAEQLAAKEFHENKALKLYEGMSEELVAKQIEQNIRDANSGRLSHGVSGYSQTSPEVPSNTLSIGTSRPGMHILLRGKSATGDENEDNDFKDDENGSIYSELENGTTESNEFLSQKPTKAPVTALSFAAQVACASASLPPFIPTSELKDPKGMSRDELRAELKQRGLCSDGVKTKLREIVVAARAGSPNVKPSPQLVYGKVSTERSGSKLKTTAVKRRQSKAEFSDHAGDGQQSKRSLLHFTAESGEDQLVTITSKTVPGNIDAKLSAKMTPYLYYPHRVRGEHREILESVRTGRRLFLCNLPSGTTVSFVEDLVKDHAVEWLHPMDLPGHFVVDCVDVESAVNLTDAMLGIEVKGQLVFVKNATEIVYSREQGASEILSATTYQPDTNISNPLNRPKHASEQQSREKVTGSLLRATDVPSSVTASDLRAIFGSSTVCNQTGPGVWLFEFPEVGYAEFALASAQNFRIWGQPIHLRRVEADTPIETGRRQRQREPEDDMSDDTSEEM